MYRLDLFEYPAVLMERLDHDAAEPLRNGHGLPTSSIFPKFEALMSLGRYQDALGFVIDRTSTAAYRSWSDLVLCEIFPEYAETCLAYYDAEDGVQLKDTWSGEEARRCEHAMLALLGLALIIREDNLGDDVVCPVGWQKLVQMAREIVSMAPRQPATMPQ